MKALYLWIGAALLLPGPGIAQTPRTKSVENIVNGLLGGKSGATRVAKGVRAAPAARDLPAAAPDASTAIVVDVAVKYQQDGQTKLLLPGGSLTPDDNYRITFTASRSGYVYVYQFDAAGKTDLVFPNAEYSPERNPVVGERTYSVPPEGQWLALDHTRGHEDIVVLASDQPLGEAQAIATDVRGQNVHTATQTVSRIGRGVRGGQSAGLFAFRLGFEHR